MPSMLSFRELLNEMLTRGDQLAGTVPPSPPPMTAPVAGTRRPSGRDLMGWKPQDEAITNPPGSSDLTMPALPGSPVKSLPSPLGVPGAPDLETRSASVSRGGSTQTKPSGRAKPRSKPSSRGPLSSSKITQPFQQPSDLGMVDPSMLGGSSMMPPEAAPALPPLYSQPTSGYQESAVPGQSPSGPTIHHARRNALLRLLGKIAGV